MNSFIVIDKIEREEKSGRRGRKLHKAKNSQRGSKADK